MERTISVEEKIRRAEEIYEKRHSNSRPVTTVSVGKEKKDVKLLKKMIIQIIVCIAIYMIIYAIQNSEMVFSKDFVEKANAILSYDTNFNEIYEKAKEQLLKMSPTKENENQGIGGASEENTSQEEQGTQETNEEQTNQNSAIQPEEKQLSQEEQDINNVKSTTTFLKPIDGVVSSKFGYRETATGAVPKNHTGTDIAANAGTKIKSATDGEIVLASEEGDYGKHLKVQIGEVSIIYAHCNQLYVKQGEHVKQGQEIAEVGSTGNSTGPHLHFEVRYQERVVNPQKILEI